MVRGKDGEVAYLVDRRAGRRSGIRRESCYSGMHPETSPHILTLVIHPHTPVPKRCLCAGQALCDFRVAQTPDLLRENCGRSEKVFISFAWQLSVWPAKWRSQSVVPLKSGLANAHCRQQGITKTAGAHWDNSIRSPKGIG
jgi:hypothetical protein